MFLSSFLNNLCKKGGFEMMHKSLLKKLGLVVVVVALFLSASQSAWGGFQEGLDAARRGDYATALKEWRPLAEQGHASAQYTLGLMYRNGRGVPKDYKLAVKWYRKSAEQGKASAQYNLGFMYEKGLGVPKDYVLSHMWFNLSAANGNKNGQKNRDIVEKRMTPSQIEDAQRLAREWLEKHRQK
jgi:hypothetical protein